MDKFNFYYKWLRIMSFAVIFLGLFMALLKSTPLFAVFNALIDPVFWGDKLLDAGTAAYKNFIYSLTGAIMTACGVQMAFVLKNAFVKKEKWAWLCIFTSIAVMFVIDEAFSIYYKVYYNALFNISFYFLIIFPLIMTRSMFSNSISPKLKK